MTLRVEVERTRVVIGTVVALAFVSRIVLVFYGGVEMEEIAVQEDARDYTSEGKLIDNYNSYSATVVSLFGRPIGVFIQLVVQLFALRFPSTAILQPETPWHVRGGALCSAAALAYLVNNGLNALNAQLRPLEVQPVISAADLSISMSNNDSWSADEITNVSQVVSEASPGNPISNTVLRNLVLPRIWTQERVCTSAVSTEPLPLIYEGLIAGLKEVQKKGWTPLEVVGSSSLVHQQMSKYKPPRKKRLLGFYAVARRLADSLGVRHWHHHQSEFNRMERAAATHEATTRPIDQAQQHWQRIFRETTRAGKATTGVEL
ncbi:hypothetical protein Poli38472_007066 [Pythium oligandrum]|uniref:RNase H type-1 domain-containing protein n=1 Tax=Pythium oligandrum TaxID=41045 RepID=A0A8K1FE07_PYTOL|nr:hypothetical protein Poli38472_007066 [Pythium oligandrum]|eukprot:TMW58921.1 hypothetical protein Poli38472_007066 [Pythium oligandrum]